MPDYKLLIDGALVDGAAQMDVINPATETVLAQAPRASAEQLDAAVAAAKAAFPGWAATPIETRRAALFRLADAIEAQVAPLGRLLTQEQGKPIAEAQAEVSYAAAFVRHLAGFDMESRTIEDGERRTVLQHRRPLGVVAAILPWNFPVLTITTKLPLALLAGNCVVLKPAPTTPLTALKIGELMADIFPAGVVNVIADANDLGDRLTSHPDVAKVSFTGSTATGRKVMASAAATIKRVTLELGGNDAAIVLDDADPQTVAPALFAAAFGNAGQVCIAAKRVYAHDMIYDALCDAMAKIADATVVDDGLSQGAQMGPLQNKAQYDKVTALIAEASTQGTVIAGGESIDRPGYFIRPTLVRDIVDGTRLVDEEQFGPVLPIIRYDDIDDVITRANASPYGLGASIWGSDRERARAVAQRMDAGTVWINIHGDIGPNMPFSGAKQSGLGTEFAEEGLAEFTQLRVINEAL